jgi:hypothetical protein
LICLLWTQRTSFLNEIKLFICVVEFQKLKVQNPTGKSSLFFLSAWNKQLFAVITDVLLFRGLMLL